MSKAALSDFLVKQAFLGAAAEYMGLSGGVYHGDTSDYPYVSGTLTARQIIVSQEPAVHVQPIKAGTKPEVIQSIRTSPVMKPSYGESVTMIYRARQEAAMRAAAIKPEAP